MDRTKELEAFSKTPVGRYIAALPPHGSRRIHIVPPLDYEPEEDTWTQVGNTDVVRGFLPK